MLLSTKRLTAMAAPPLSERAWPFPLAKPALLQLLSVYRHREPFTGEIATLTVTIRWQRRMCMDESTPSTAPRDFWAVLQAAKL